MEEIFKKYYWAVNLLFLGLAAWFLAGTVNVVIAHKVRTMQETGTKKAAPGKMRNAFEGGLESYDAIVARNFFNSALAKRVEAPVEEDPNEGDTGIPDEFEGSGELSDIRATLVGTVVAPDYPEWSMAVIVDLDAAETRPYRVDDELLEVASVVAIRSSKVYIYNNGQLEYLELQDKAQARSPRPNKPPPKTAGDSGSDDSLGEGIKKTGENSWSIERAEIDKTLNNLNNIAMQARIVPSFKDGESNGFKLFAIRPGSLYSKLGIQNGDIIHKINGFPMNSPDKALEVYQKLKSARNVEIEVTRRGKAQKLNYTIE